MVIFFILGGLGFALRFPISNMENLWIGMICGIIALALLAFNAVITDRIMKKK